MKLIKDGLVLKPMWISRGMSRRGVEEDNSSKGVDEGVVAISGLFFLNYFKEGLLGCSNHMHVVKSQS